VGEDQGRGRCWRRGRRITHVITPVPGADYNILQVLYATFKDPAEQKELYDMYRGAFAANLGISSGSIAADLSK